MTGSPFPRVHATADASYATLREGEFARTIEVSELVLADLDPDGCVLGIEVLDGSDWTGALVALVMSGSLRMPAKTPEEAV